MNNTNLEKDLDKEFSDGIKSTLPDVFFVFLPLIVIFIVSAFKSDPSSIFKQAEWSFAAAVLSGQSIVKVVFAISSRHSTIKIKSHNIAIMIAATIVLLLVPSLIVLVFMLITDPLPNSLLIIQIILFTMSLVVYIVLGALSESMPKSEKNNSEAKK